MSVVRPEFGPTLPELLGPRLRVLPSAVRWGLAALGIAVLALVAALALGITSSENTAVVRGPLSFNLVYGDALERVAPRTGELLRLQTPSSAARKQSMAVRAIRLPAYRGDINGFLPYYASRLIDADQRNNPNFLLRGEGRVRINTLPGYGYYFQTRVGGRLVYGRRVLLFADEAGQRDGADVLLLAERSQSVPRADSVGAGGALKAPYRSFRLGTERP